MKLLLDTHVAVWAALADEPFERFRAVMEDPTNEIFVSPVLAWELAIKVQAGKLRLATSVDGFVQQVMAALRAVDLPVRTVHAVEIERLPMIHGDPFDRMLVAQARVETLTLATSDAKVRQYPVTLFPSPRGAPGS